MFDSLTHSLKKGKVRVVFQFNRKVPSFDGDKVLVAVLIFIYNVIPLVSSFTTFFLIAYRDLPVFMLLRERTIYISRSHNLYIPYVFRLLHTFQCKTSLEVLSLKALRVLRF